MGWTHRFRNHWLRLPMVPSANRTPQPCLHDRCLAPWGLPFTGRGQASIGAPLRLGAWIHGRLDCLRRSRSRRRFSVGTSRASGRWPLADDLARRKCVAWSVAEGVCDRDARPGDRSRVYRSMRRPLSSAIGECSILKEKVGSCATRRQSRMTYLNDWLVEYCSGDRSVFVKRLAGDDTYANGVHSGLCLPKEFFRCSFPELLNRDVLNPEVQFDLLIDSHRYRSLARAVWHNDPCHGGASNEVRLVDPGGTSSALLDPENTGAVAIFALSSDAARECHAWVCRDIEEEDVADYRFGPIEPGISILLA